MPDSFQIANGVNGQFIAFGLGAFYYLGRVSVQKTFLPATMIIVPCQQLFQPDY